MQPHDAVKIINCYTLDLTYINVDRTKLTCLRNPLKHVSLYCALTLHTTECRTVCECQPIQFVDSAKNPGIHSEAIYCGLVIYHICVLNSEVLHVYCFILKCIFHYLLDASPRRV